MRERGITFTAEMVRAIMAGRKTQTRRVMRLQPAPSRGEDAEPGDIVLIHGWPHRLEERCKCGECPECYRHDVGDLTPRRIPCPYGEDGRGLYVQEGCRIERVRSGGVVSGKYLCDGAQFSVALTNRERSLFEARKKPYAKMPGRFMYRSLARTRLEVMAARPEQVQEITEDDAQAEGCVLPEHYEALSYSQASLLDPYRSVFEGLWNSINAARGYGWDANPWVWAIPFAEKSRQNCLDNYAELW